MQLVLGNTQGELSPLEIGMHALKAVPLSEGGRGKRGGLREYAERAGFGAESLRQWRAAADVANTAKTSWQYIADRVSHLYEISKAPRESWPLLVERLISKDWTVADTSHEVDQLRKFSVPAEWPREIQGGSPARAAVSSPSTERRRTPTVLR